MGCTLKPIKQINEQPQAEKQLTVGEQTRARLVELAGLPANSDISAIALIDRLADVGVYSSEEAARLRESHVFNVQSLADQASADAAGQSQSYGTIDRIDGNRDLVPEAVGYAATDAELTLREVQLNADRQAGLIDDNVWEAVTAAVATNRQLIETWNAIADREVINVIGSVYGGVDMVKGGYRIAVNGEHTADNYLSAAAPALGGELGTAGKLGGRVVAKSGAIDYLSASAQKFLHRPYISAATRRAMGPVPPGMRNPHKHHILDLNGRAGEHRALVREGQDILRDVGIDPLKGLENLTWAPNRGHTMQATANLVSKLRQDAGSRKAILRTLEEFRDAARNR